MELKLIEKKQNPLLERTELVFELDTKGGPTPKEEDVKKEVIKKEKTAEEKNPVEIKGIYPRFGTTKAVVHAYIYFSPSSLERLRKKRRRKKEEKKK